MPASAGMRASQLTLMWSVWATGHGHGRTLQGLPATSQPVFEEPDEEPDEEPEGPEGPEDPEDHETWWYEDAQLPLPLSLPIRIWAGIESDDPVSSTFTVKLKPA